MNREILFRGERKDNGELVYGDLVRNYFHAGDTCIGGLFENRYICVPVVPATVGQYTGLPDKNGRRIFDGDICKDSLGVVFVVEWEKEARFLGFTVGKERRIAYVGREPKVEVIGNIHDNPELLKEGDHDN